MSTELDRILSPGYLTDLEARSTDEIRSMHGRVLLRPYYYVNGDDARLSGIQAIVCPTDKKVLHGMTDAILMPCAADA